MRRVVLVVVAVFLSLDVWAACDFQAAKTKAIQLVSSVSPKMEGEATYTQHLSFPNGTKAPLPSRRDFRSRELPVGVMNMSTCEVGWFLEKRKIEKGALSQPLNGKFQLAVRPFGSIWNDFNTQLQSPKHVALVLKWVRFDGGPTVYYVPYSPDLARTFPGLAEDGKRHFLADMDEALAKLLRLGLIDSDLESLLHDILPHLFASESIDPFEFKTADTATRLRLLNQPFVTLGANGNSAFTLKVSSAGAKGPMQVWGPSCKDLHGLYPSAELAADCNGASWGTHSHVGNIAAAALEVKMHLGRLKLRFGSGILSNPELDRMLKASYNGGPGWVVKAYRDHGRKWDELHVRKVSKKKGKKVIKETVVAQNSLRPETVDYLLKCDFLKKNSAELYPRTMIGGAP